MRLKWRVDPEPTGRYRAFAKRGWPTAEDENGKHIASLYHEQSYTAALAKDAGENSIAVRIADWSKFPWQGRILKARFSNVKSAKEAAERFLNNHPEYHPTKETR